MYILNTDKGCSYGTSEISCFENDELIKSVWVDDNSLPEGFLQNPTRFNYANGNFVPRDMTIDNLKAEQKNLQSFIDSADYVTIKLYRASLQGQDLLDEYSDTFKMTNREVLQKVDEAILRINEINALLETTT
jgi:hypothetical protein